MILSFSRNLDLTDQYMEFIIISNSKWYHNIFHILFPVWSSYSTILIWSRIKAFRNSKIVSISPFFNLKNFVNIRTGPFYSQIVDCSFKSTKKLNNNILGWLNKSKTLGPYGFPLVYPHIGAILYCVPDGEIWRDPKFDRCAGAIWNFGNL